MNRPCLALATLLAAAPLIAQTAPAEPDDRFIAGYAAAVLEREFSLKPEGLEVADGVIRYPERGFGTIERQQLIKSLMSIRGVREVQLVRGEAEVDRSATQPVRAPATPGARPAPVEPASEEPLTLFLSTGRLFEPLIADPRWPHFFASYNYYADAGNVDIRHVGSVGFGETISIVRKSYPSNLRWEAGVQAGVFAIFDLDSDSKDLINADYFVGPYMSLRFEDFSLIARYYHQSSHLGDEYLLRENIDGDQRVNLSYEAIDLLLSYELPAGLRVYGGASHLLNMEPTDLKELNVQYGAEWRSPHTIMGGALRPVAAGDFQHREENDWDMDLSLRAGFSVEDPGRFSQRLMFLFEYYNGRSPNGQFYGDRIEYYGFGMHFYF